MAEKRPALGRGLSALIPDAAGPTPPRDSPAAVSPQASDRPTELDIDRLIPNPRQPRVAIDDLKLDELAQSIRANGVIQPVIVRKTPGADAAPPGTGRYEIIAGERR